VFFLKISMAYTYDCLSLARTIAQEHPQDDQGKQLLNFYRYISALYVQMHTNNPTKYGDKYDLLTLRADNYIDTNMAIDAPLGSLIKELLSDRKDENYRPFVKRELLKIIFCPRLT
jgi:hypothetical protein